MDTLLTLHTNNVGKVSDKWSSYLTYYDSLFRPIRHLPIQLLEIGIQNGGSLEIWAQYFANSISIVGCDLDEKCKSLVFENPRIHLIIGNINSQTAYDEVLKLKPFDVIIDDGSHHSRDILLAFLNFFPLVKPGGIFVIEDAHSLYHPTYGGGILNGVSAKEFFKLLIDIVNYEFWSEDVSMETLLSSFLPVNQFPSFVKEGWIDSLEFRNSIITIRKAVSAGHDKIGQRLVRGAEAAVSEAPLSENGATHPFKSSATSR